MMNTKAGKHNQSLHHQKLVLTGSAVVEAEVISLEVSYAND
jgi:hypothetical protein